MSNAITDTAGVALTSLSLTLKEGEETGVFVGLVPCVAGMFLASTPNPLSSVLARRTNSGDAFVALAVSPVDLTPFAGQTVAFDFKVQAGAVATRTLAALPVRVTYNP